MFLVNADTILARGFDEHQSHKVDPKATKQNAIKKAIESCESESIPLFLISDKRGDTHV